MGLPLALDDTGLTVGRVPAARVVGVARVPVLAVQREDVVLFGRLADEFVENADERGEGAREPEVLLMRRQE